MVDAGRQRVHRVLPDHPHAPDVRGDLACLGVDRGRVAGHAPVVGRRVDGELRIERALRLGRVPGALSGPRRLPRHPPLPAQGTRAQVPQTAHRRVRRVGRRGQQPHLGPAPAVRLREAALGEVTAVEGADLAVEVAPVRRPHPVLAGQHEQHVVQRPLQQRGTSPAEVGALLQEREQALVLREDLEVPPPRGLGDRALPALPVLDPDPVQTGDAVRQHHRPVGDRRVLVQPRRVLQAVLLEEGAPVRLVPGDQEQVQVLRALPDAERLRARRGQQVRRLTAPAPAPPVGAHVVEDQDVRVAGRLETRGEGGQQAWRVAVVAVEEQDVVAGRLLPSGVAGPAQADVLGQVQHPHPGVAGGVLVEDRAAAVGGAVVHGDHFEVAVRLGEHRVETLAQEALHLVDGDDDAEAGHFFGQLLTRVAAGAGTRSASGITGGIDSGGSPSSTRRTTRSAARPSSNWQKRSRNAARRAVADPSA